jgi:hypothetical protein
MTATTSAVVVVLEWMRLHHTPFSEYILILQTDPDLNPLDLAESIPMKLEPKSSVFSKLSGTQETTFSAHLTGTRQRSELETRLKELESIQGYQILTPSHEIAD